MTVLQIKQINEPITNQRKLFIPITVIVNVAFAELEETSTAVYVTMVSPIEKVDPEL